MGGITICEVGQRFNKAAPHAATRRSIGIDLSRSGIYILCGLHIGVQYSYVNI